MRKLYFAWGLNKEVNNADDITHMEVHKQQLKLTNMLEDLQTLINQNTKGVKIKSNYIRNCSGCFENKKYNIKKYSINNQMDICISKEGRNTTWNDVFTLINKIKPAKYDLR